MPRQQITDLRMPTPLDDPATLRLMNRQPRDGDRVSMHGRLHPCGHTIEITCEHRAGSYRVAGVRITAGDDDEITGEDLGLPVKERALAVLSRVSALFGELDQDALTARVAEFGRTQRYRLLTDEHLQLVADVHAHAVTRGASSVIRAIREHFSVSQSTAERWIRVARARGFIEPSPRQRKDG